MNLIEFLEFQPYAFHFSMAVLGLVAGSFLNVVILRLPKRLEFEWRRECASVLGVETPATVEPPGLVSPRSRCPHCGHAISALENVPILSWLWLRGHCSACRGSISARYPLVELTSGVLTTVVSVHFGFGAQALLAAVLTWALIALSMIDFDTGFLPDDITLPMLWLGIIVNSCPKRFRPDDITLPMSWPEMIANACPMFTNLNQAVAGAILGYLALWICSNGYRLIRGQQGMGNGDFKLLAMLGAWAGVDTLILTVVVSSFVGSVVGLSLMLFKNYGLMAKIPFGPYLAVAGWISLLWGDKIMKFYGNLG